MSLSLDLQRKEAAAQRLYAASKDANLTPSVTYTNATTKGIYQGFGMATVRVGADDHLQHASLGMGKQLVRCV